MQSTAELYGHFETLLFKVVGDSLKFISPADHGLAGEFEEQMTALEQEYLESGEYLSVHNPDTADGRDEAPNSTALMLMASREE